MKFNVGDIVWSYEEDNYVRAYEITHVGADGYYDASPVNMTSEECDDDYGILFDDRDIGEFVFLTEEECINHKYSDDK